MAVSRGDPARLQRATQGAGESTGRGCHQVVQRGGMRFVYLWIDSVVFGYLRVDSEEYWPRLRGQVRPTEGALDARDSHHRSISDWVCHLYLYASFFAHGRWVPTASGKHSITASTAGLAWALRGRVSLLYGERLILWMRLGILWHPFFSRLRTGSRAAAL